MFTSIVLFSFFSYIVYRLYLSDKRNQEFKKLVQDVDRLNKRTRKVLKNVSK